MTDETVFINNQGEEVYLPESAGKALGLKKASTFIPEETKAKPAQSQSMSGKPTFNQAVSLIREFLETATPEERMPERIDELSALASQLNGLGLGSAKTAQDVDAEREHAMTVLYGVAMNGPDELSAETADGLHRLTERLVDNGFGPQPSEGQDDQTGGPSLVDAIAVLEKQIDADGKKTPAQKKKLKEHLQELLDNAEPGDTPLAE